MKQYLYLYAFFIVTIFLLLGTFMFRIFILKEETTLFSDSSQNETILTPIPLGNYKLVSDINAVDDVRSIISNKDGSRVYVPSLDEDIVYIISTETDEVITKLAFSQPFTIALEEANNHVYIADISGDLLVYDLEQELVIHHTQIDRRPFQLVISEKHSILLASNARGNTVQAFNTETRRLLSPISVGSEPRGIGLLDNYAYIANYNDNSVSVISLDSLTVVHTIPVIGRPEFIATDPRTQTIYVTERYNKHVVKIDALTWEVDDYIPIPSVPSMLAIDFDYNQLLIAGFNNNTITVIDVETHEISDVLGARIGFNIDHGFNDMVILQGRNKMYLTNTLKGSILVYERERVIP